MIRRSPWKDPLLIILAGLLITELLALGALFWLKPSARGDTNTQYRHARLLPPGSKGQIKKEGGLHIFLTEKPDGENTDNFELKTFWLGTDAAGRDYLDRLLVGARMSLSIGFLGMLVALLMGWGLGTLAGFFGGRTDAVVLWIVQVLWTFPTVFLALAFSLVLGKGYWTLVLAIGLSLWTETARVVRGEALRWKKRLFMDAAQVLGFSSWRRLLLHLTPNMLPVVLISSVSHFSTAVLLESGLSFLGLGIDPPYPSLGNLLAENKIFLFSRERWLVFFPALILAGNSLMIILLANRLRDILDIRQDPPST
ncbi:MAG: ABC transporter permease [Flavobacteriales bacterium]|nr:ABC transporter permease [Flavobacteriales bacterium]MDW8432073.1 ABC transporter permease [Flavobacteriales bacterium]